MRKPYEADHLDYSYRILQAGKVWRWEVVSPGGKILSEGTADSRLRAAAQAMVTWLDLTEEQGNAKERNTRGVRH